MRKTPIIATAAIALALLTPQCAWAVCPICTLAVGVGVGFSRWLGIDDAITGLWIGGLIVSMITWTESFLDVRNIRFKGRAYVDTIAYFTLTVIPLYYAGIIGNPINAMCGCGIDKLLWGIVTGSSGFWFGASWYFYLKEKHGGHAYFPFQKVIMPIVPLLFLTMIFYLLG
ncbi:MAG: hypothetical protein VB032_00995 [Burkholderiaceae bacterium]|nr:hypothetical protein [Burkholderiaceae bacterium]